MIDKKYLNKEEKRESKIKGGRREVLKSRLR